MLSIGPMTPAESLSLMSSVAGAPAESRSVTLGLGSVTFTYHCLGNAAVQRVTGTLQFHGSIRCASLRSPAHRLSHDLYLFL